MGLLMRDKRPYFEWMIKILGTGLFLWLILRSTNLQEIFQLLKNISLWGYIPIFLLFLLKQFLTTVRWKALLNFKGILEPIKPLYFTVLYGQSLNQILPSRIGGDSARVAYLFTQYPKKKAAALSATFLDRLLGLIALILLAFIDIPFVQGFNPGQKAVGVVLLSILVILVILTFWGKLDWMFSWLMKLKWFPETIRVRIKIVWDILVEYRDDRRVLFWGLILSLMSQGLMIIGQYLTFQLIGVQVSLIDLFLVIPVVTLIVTLPISIGGIGVREVTLVSLLTIQNNEVVSFSLIRYSFYILLPMILLLQSFVEFIKNVWCDRKNVL